MRAIKDLSSSQCRLKKYFILLTKLGNAVPSFYFEADWDFNLPQVS